MAQTLVVRMQSYLKLCKCRVIGLMLVTTWVGMCLATPGWVPWQAFVVGTVGIALSAASGAVINHVVDQDFDAIMRRTQHRPIVQGNVHPMHALIFGVILGLMGIGMLVLWVNTLTAVLTFLALIGYAVVYSIWLKHATSQNIVIGGLAGAMPPLLGWTAVTAYVDPSAWVLVMIIFVWTPPHFWALAIYRYEDYKAANIPMLPVTHGISLTKFLIVLYTILLLAVSMLPFIINLSGWLYLIVANMLGLAFCALAMCLKYSDSRWLAFQTFRFSIVYLALLFTAMLIDHYLPWQPI